MVLRLAGIYPFSRRCSKHERDAFGWVPLPVLSSAVYIGALAFLLLWRECSAGILAAASHHRAGRVAVSRHRQLLPASDYGAGCAAFGVSL